MLTKLFNDFDKDKTGKLDVAEVENLLAHLGVAPLANPMKRTTASHEEVVPPKETVEVEIKMKEEKL